MSLKREIEVFDGVAVSAETGETDVWDRALFPTVIRKREIDIILSLANRTNPNRTLDFGCGAGWVSRALSANGYTVTGFDSSRSLVASAARHRSDNSQFAVADAMNLPFKQEQFDLIIAVAILHHLDPASGLAECRRILSPSGTLLLMEPNKYNPLAAMARKLMPVDTQTPDEEPFRPGQLKALLQQSGWEVNRFGYLFPYSFALSQLLRKTRTDWRIWSAAGRPVTVSEHILETVPFLNRLCWVIVVEAKKA